MIEYGTQIVGGVAPGKGGSSILDRPVYHTVAEALIETAPNASIIFVPAEGAADAVFEAMDAGLHLIIIITEGIPLQHMMHLNWEAHYHKVMLVGPNTPGIISPGKAKAGIMPGNIFAPGKIGIISRSGTLMYEFVRELTLGGYGQSTCIGVGSGLIIGASFTEMLEHFSTDEDTEAVILIGEIGGSDEIEAAKWVRTNMPTVPVIGFIAGRYMPLHQISYAGTVIDQMEGSTSEKISSFRAMGIPIVERPAQICAALDELGIKPNLGNHSKVNLNKLNQ